MVQSDLHRKNSCTVMYIRALLKCSSVHIYNILCRLALLFSVSDKLPEYARVCCSCTSQNIYNEYHHSVYLTMYSTILRIHAQYMTHLYIIYVVSYEVIHYTMYVRTC